MREIRSTVSVERICAGWRRAGLTVGFVPTMGALHAGHLSLVRASLGDCDRTVVSIFVNPTQFGPGEDFTSYPRALAADRRALAPLGVSVLFTPSGRAIYPRGHATGVEVGHPLTSGLCARFRPGHFRGVTTVVTMLLNIVRPHIAYFGAKDAQQVAVVRRMVADLKMKTGVRVLPIVRERDGLAMSSRNRRLRPEGRRAASVLFRGLLAARAAAVRGLASPSGLARVVRSTVRSEPSVRLQYVAVVDPATMAPVRRGFRRALVALAAHVDGVRLIDNLIVRTAVRRRGGR